ncbi:MAG: type VI secretion system tube protein Hcp [Bacteroidetes bacterium]|nr:type VI secretion system tube protein Hcp [Bacteroidota bacterium]
MALTAYLKITAANSGLIKGNVKIKGREDTIAVYAFDHSITSPRDPASGLPSGRRQHKPLIITKEIDPSTPLLYQVLVNNENISRLELNFWAPAASRIAGVAGAEVNVLRIVLTNANIADIHAEMWNNRVAENATIPVLETVSFSYQKIEWTWLQGGITAMDDWESAQV